MTSICLATSYDAKFENIGDYAAMALRLYARKHGYAAHVEKNVSIDRPTAWHRVALIPALFDAGFDFVLWVDADAIFMRFDVPISSVITEAYDVYMVQHEVPCYAPTPVPNTGVLLVRNCSWSRQLFARLWEMEEYVHHCWWENAALIKLMGYNSLLDEGEDEFNQDLLSRIKFLDDDWNFVPSVCSEGDPIIRHYAGCSLEHREQVMPKAALAACFRALEEGSRDAA